MSPTTMTCSVVSWLLLQPTPRWKEKNICDTWVTENFISLVSVLQNNYNSTLIHGSGMKRLFEKSEFLTFQGVAVYKIFNTFYQWNFQFYLILYTLPLSFYSHIPLQLCIHSNFLEFLKIYDRIHIISIALDKIPSTVLKW